ncbi:uncharacterized protein LOC132756144 [Ruditapes philippinarum]|uniref:uncharacterized protein LOC132756144 n=1 Tax=Ruditapes philippinarum TaxID=129788 RepID=UPI00295A917D|nr:uncharacterized protein LOC132756144 [Ruditapes philippinarum]
MTAAYLCSHHRRQRVMNFYLGIVLAAAIAAVYSTSCKHGDVSMCGGLNCTDDSMVVGCEHEVCTCVMDTSGGNGNDCMDIGDCLGREHELHCKHDEEAHCLDRMCACLKMPHHG